MNRYTASCALAAALALPVAPAGSQPAAPVADLERGRAIATQVCAACHGPDGNSGSSANPKLAGQIAEYTYKQLVDFKASAGGKAQRENAVMAGMVANLSEADMRSLAAYYAAQKLKPEAARDKALAEAGQKLYRGGNVAAGIPSCAGCHGPAGEGIPSQYPRIAGQFADYLEAQLKAFRSGARANDPNGMMRGVAARMTDAEIRAVSEYVAGLRR